MSLKEQLAPLLAAKASLVANSSSLVAELKNMDLPLNERWEVFTELVKAGIIDKNESYGDGNIYILGQNLTMYDDFNVDRHQTLSYPDMYQQIMDADGEWQENLVKAREENLEAWQEHILSRDFASFTYDW